MNLFSWFGASATGDKAGKQSGQPSVSLVNDLPVFGIDACMQISAVWACVHRRATTISSLPLFVYTNVDGRRTLNRTSRLWSLMHESPNARMTPMEFWRAMLMNHDLRGNAYARLDRDPRTNEVTAMWPLAADQTEAIVLEDGTMAYTYQIGADLVVLAEENVLHLKDIGNGTVGLSRLDYMRSTTAEQQSAQFQANRIFGASGKPSGVLMVDNVLKKEQRERIQENFSGMQAGNFSRLYVLEANMKYQQLSLSPEDQQLLESRQFGVEEISRWYDVPPVLIHHSNVTAWGSGIEQLVDGWYKLAVRPMCVSIEQAIRRKVMTPRQRASETVEFSIDALLRSSLKDRMEIYAKAVQNGIKNRNECRQLENDEPYEGGELFTAQTNLAPIDMLGKIQSGGGGNVGAQDSIAQ